MAVTLRPSVNEAKIVAEAVYTGSRTKEISSAVAEDVTSSGSARPLSLPEGWDRDVERDDATGRPS